MGKVKTTNPTHNTEFTEESIDADGRMKPKAAKILGKIMGEDIKTEGA